MKNKIIELIKNSYVFFPDHDVNNGMELMREQILRNIKDFDFGEEKPKEITISNEEERFKFLKSQMYHYEQQVIRISNATNGKLPKKKDIQIEYLLLKIAELQLNSEL